MTHADILIVDDRPENLQILNWMLKKQGYQIRMADSGALALEMIQAAKPDLLLLDIMMPGIDGFELCQRVKANPEMREIPVLFLSSMQDTTYKIKAFECGAVDYITKPFQEAEVLARVTTHLTLRVLQQQLQEENTRFRTLEDAAFEGIVIHHDGAGSLMATTLS